MIFYTARQQNCRRLMLSVAFVCLFWGASYVTITHDAVDLTIQGPSSSPCSCPPSRRGTSPSTSSQDMELHMGHPPPQLPWSCLPIGHVQTCSLVDPTPQHTHTHTHECCRVATAQGKQGIWFLPFPDRENTRNFVLTREKLLT